MTWGSASTFIAADNADAAVEVGNGIIDQVRKLAAFPRLGKFFASSPQGEVRELGFGCYRLLYLLAADEREVTILRVWHGARGKPQL